MLDTAPLLTKPFYCLLKFSGEPPGLSPEFTYAERLAEVPLPQRGLRQCFAVSVGLWPHFLLLSNVKVARQPTGTPHFTGAAVTLRCIHTENVT